LRRVIGELVLDQIDEHRVEAQCLTVVQVLSRFFARQSRDERPGRIALAEERCVGCGDEIALAALESPWEYGIAARYLRLLAALRRRWRVAAAATACYERARDRQRCQSLGDHV